MSDLIEQLSPGELRLFEFLTHKPIAGPIIESECGLANISQFALRINEKAARVGALIRVKNIQKYYNDGLRRRRLGHWFLCSEAHNDE